MQRPSQQDTDGTIWTTASIRLGTAGLDLRTPAEGGSLAKLLNARFRDDKTIERRNGHRGVLLRDGGEFAIGANTPTRWVYGHGQLLAQTNASVNQSTHHPLPRTARGTFRFDGADVVWTGDRLLLSREDGNPAVGSSTHWYRAGWGEVDAEYPQVPWGVPAYLPVQADSTPPDTVAGAYVETCLTESLRVVVASNSAGDELTAWVINRDTGAVLDKSVVLTGATIRDPRVINSGDIPVIVVRDGTTVRMLWWSGVGWSIPSTIASLVSSYDVTPSPGGFTVAWLTNDVSPICKVGRFRGKDDDESDFAYGSTLPLAVTPLAGAIAVAVAPDRRVALVYQTNSDFKLRVHIAGADLGGYTDTDVDDEDGPYTSGLTACFRGLSNASGRHQLVIHAGLGDLYTGIYEFGVEYDPDINATLYFKVAQDRRYRTHVASKSWCVGNEVFCWLRARNSETLYLAAGVKPQVVGIADREAAPSRPVADGVRPIAMVAQDPRSEYLWTWARPYTTVRLVTVGDDTTKYAETYKRAGNGRIGDLDFLPALSAVKFGRSIYLAGSHVRNWDGIELGDAGFHDYPTVSAVGMFTTAGSLTPEKVYSWRVYAVRYNKRGERFQSPAITKVQATNSDTVRCTVSINTLPVTNHDDVIFEVYRTEGDGTTFYLEGTIMNDRGADTVTFTSSIADSLLRLRAADPHAPGIGFPGEVDQMGPLGCSILAVSGDRLWGAGGQVPAGSIQFSKLKEPNEGAGFDSLAGTQEIDLQGRAVTSIAGLGDAALAVFQSERVYVLFGGGPDNYGQGGFSTPQLVLADGASTHLGTAAMQHGIVFWSADGPRLLNLAFKVENISRPVMALTETLTPTGVRVDLARQEVVWYTAEGTALLLNYESGARWAQWDGLHIAGCSPGALVTTDGVLLYEDWDSAGDDGRPFRMTFSTGELHPEEMFQGATHLRRLGVTGEFEGEHRLRFRVFYDGAPLWSEEFTWEPTTGTHLVSVESVGDLTPAQFDALKYADHTGRYGTHKRVRRGACDFFRIEVTDTGAVRRSYIPFEIVCEIGRKPGMGRTAINTFKD